MNETSKLFSMEYLFILVILVAGKPLIVKLLEWLVRRQSSKSGVILSGKISAAQIAGEERSKYLVLSDPAILFTLMHFGAFHFAENTSFNGVLTFVLMFAAVDAWMYANHRAMHRFNVCARWHSHHHRSRIPRPSSALSFSVMEKLMCYSVPWLLMAAVMSWYLPISLYGIVCFYVFYFFTSSIAHSNFELFHRGQVVGKFSLLGSATSHALHHRNPGCNFGFFTTVYDHIFGTAATPAAHASLLAKRELT